MLNTGTATPRLDLLGPILQEGIPQDVYVSHRVLPTLLVQKKNGAIPSFLLTNDQDLNIKHAPRPHLPRSLRVSAREPTRARRLALKRLFPTRTTRFSARTSLRRPLPVA